MDNQTENNIANEIDNPEVLGHTLLTQVNHKYDGPNADNPKVFPA